MLEQYRNLAAEAADKTGVTSNISTILCRGRQTDAGIMPSNDASGWLVFRYQSLSISSNGTGPQKSIDNNCSNSLCSTSSIKAPTAYCLVAFRSQAEPIWPRPGYQRLKGWVLFATAVDVINTLTAAQAAGQLKNSLKTYLRPSVLILDELGYLPIDKHGADLLFQVISCDTKKGLSSLPQTGHTNTGRKFSTMTRHLPPPSLTGFCITPTPSL